MTTNLTPSWPDVAGCDITEYVKKALDGALVDGLDEPDYRDEANRAENQAHAKRVIVAALSDRYRRPLNASDEAKVCVALVSEWETRQDRADEQAYASIEGALWRDVDMKTYDRMN